MGLINGIKKVVKGILKDTSDKIKVETDDEVALQKWQKKLQSAKTFYNPTIMDEREALYAGTRLVDSNVNTKNKPTKAANNVYNIAFEFIEAQVNTNIPQPAVKSKRKGFEMLAKMVEDSLISDLKDIDIEEINDSNERTTPVQGYSIITLDWDDDYKHHIHKGCIKASFKHPKQLITQPGVYNIQKMDYYFILSNVTKEYCLRRYGVDVENEEQQYPDSTSLNDQRNSLTLSTSGTTTQAQGRGYNETVTEIVCWYKDEDNDICKFVWVNDIPLENLPKYYYRRQEKCLTCGTLSPQGTDECPDCKGKKFENIVMEKETLIRDILVNGQPVPKGTQIPYFTPDIYPIIIRKNVPKQLSFEGGSDIDILRDQQDSIKKAGTKLEEKQLQGGYLIKMPENLNRVEISNATYQIIKGSPSDLASIEVKDIAAPISTDLEYIDFQRKMVQQMLGIPQSFLGQEDPTAASGKAKQVQIQQATGRMQSKQYNKNAAFKEMYMIMFFFKLAFFDEPRPYLTKDQQGNDDWGLFDRYQFLVQDDAGEWYYNTDFIFSADSNAGLPKDPMFMYEQANQQLSSGAMNNVQYWTIMESLHYPNATDIKQQSIELMQSPPPFHAPPKETMAFDDMPIAAKVQFLAKIGITVTAQDFISDMQLEQQIKNQPQPQIQPQQFDPNQNHNQAMDLTQMHVDQQNTQASQQHDLEKIALQHRASSELSAQQHDQKLEEIAAKVRVDAFLNAGKASHNTSSNVKKE